MGEGSEFGDWKAVKSFKEVLAFFFKDPRLCPTGTSHTLIPIPSTQRPKISSFISYSMLGSSFLLT